MHAFISLSRLLRVRTLPSPAQCTAFSFLYAFGRTQAWRYGSYLHTLFGYTAKRTAHVRVPDLAFYLRTTNVSPHTTSFGISSAVFYLLPLVRVSK